MVRNLFRISLITLLLFPLLLSPAPAHKFYVSVTNIYYSEKDDALQITSRLFLDDLELVIKERYGFDSGFGTPSEDPRADDYLEKYLREKLLFTLNGEARKFNYVGKKYDMDVVVCFLEIPEAAPSGLQRIDIQNELLIDLFEEQQNVVHMKVGELRKSFVLLRESNKGTLNL